MHMQFKCDYKSIFFAFMLTRPISVVGLLRKTQIQTERSHLELLLIVVLQKVVDPSRYIFYTIVRL